jgi:DNA-binding transcriptional LysR family regulator
MRFTLRQIEAFYWTAKLGSIHGAAKHLNFSQPAVSSRIKELEGALNLELFSRKKQRIELTAAGRNALAHAERVLNAGKEFEQLGVSAAPVEGVLRLGSDESTAMVALTEALTRLKQRHPRLIVELIIDVGTVLTEKLRKRELDIALHTSSGAASHVIDELLGWVEYQWVASRDMEVPEGVFVPAVAARLPIVTNSPPSTLNGIVHKWLHSGGQDFDGVNCCNSLSLMLRLVRARHAVAVLPVAILREQLAAGELRVLAAKPELPPAPYYASYLKEQYGPGIEVIIEIVRSVLQDSRFFTRVAEPPARAPSSAHVLKEKSAAGPC